jgi:hypothetical protein
MSERYLVSASRNVHAAYQRFVSRNRLRRRMFQLAEVLDRLVLRLRGARRARDWAVRKLR